LRSLNEKNWIARKELGGNFRKWGSFYDDRTHLFSIYLAGCADKSLRFPEVWLPKLSGHGGLAPAGFLDLTTKDGQSLLTRAAPQLRKTEEGARGTLEIKYGAPEADVLVTLTVNENDAKLFMTVRLDPRAKVGGYTLRLKAFPSSMGRFAKLPSRRDRFIATAKRQKSPAKKPLKLDPRSEPWILCGDRIWDGSPAGKTPTPKDAPKGRKGYGPCAFLYPPGEPAEVAATVTANEVKLKLSYSPETRTIHLVLWQNFRDMDNSNALRYLKGLKFKPIE